MRIPMSISVQNVNGAQFVPRRDYAEARPETSTIDVVDRDEYVPSRLVAASNPYDKALDRLRTAALRRDAAATATRDPSKPDGAPDDAAIARERRASRK